MTKPAASAPLAGGLALALAIGASGCALPVAVQGGDKPITINLNVKIDQEVRYRMDKEVADIIAKNPDVF